MTSPSLPTPPPPPPFSTRLCRSVFSLSLSLFLFIFFFFTFHFPLLFKKFSTTAVIFIFNFIFFSECFILLPFVDVIERIAIPFCVQCLCVCLWTNRSPVRTTTERSPRKSKEENTSPTRKEYVQRFYPSADERSNPFFPLFFCFNFSFIHPFFFLSS